MYIVTVYLRFEKYTVIVSKKRDDICALFRSLEQSTIVENFYATFIDGAFIPLSAWGFGKVEKYKTLEEYNASNIQ